MRKNTKRSAVIAGVATVAIAGGAAAWAAGWGVEGDGEATATASTITKMSATSNINGKIHPGFQTTMSSAVTNQNDFAVKLTGSVTPRIVTVTPANEDCRAAILSPGILNTDFPGTPTIPAGANGFAVTSNITIGQNLPEACAGKVIKVTYGFTGVSAA